MAKLEEMYKSRESAVISIDLQSPMTPLDIENSWSRIHGRINSTSSIKYGLSTSVILAMSVGNPFEVDHV